MSDPIENSENIVIEGAYCPLPLEHSEQIVIGHGSGGKMTHDLIQKVFHPYFKNEYLAQGNDFSLIVPDRFDRNKNWVFTTDSHVVTPLFFPGGDIGRLAICGTVNDICVSGGQPLFLTAGFIIEEGLSISVLHKVLASMREAANEAGVSIIAGDTKVVEKGKADQLFITTSGFGLASPLIQLGGQFAKPGDQVIITGTIGDHGIAVLAARGELGFSSDIQSDVAPLNHMVQSLLEVAPHTHVIRDPTRGGLATTLNEIARQSNVGIVIDEINIPVNPTVHSVCELMGFDPLYIANEGKLVIIVPEEEADLALKEVQSTLYGGKAAIIGKIVSEPPKRVLLKTTMGGTRILDMLAGEMLPRIC